MLRFSENTPFPLPPPLYSYDFTSYTRSTARSDYPTRHVGPDRIINYMMGNLFVRSIIPDVQQTVRGKGRGKRKTSEKREKETYRRTESVLLSPVAQSSERSLQSAASCKTGFSKITIRAARIWRCSGKKKKDYADGFRRENTSRIGEITGDICYII